MLEQKVYTLTTFIYFKKRIVTMSKTALSLCFILLFLFTNGETTTTQMANINTINQINQIRDRNVYCPIFMHALGMC